MDGPGRPAELIHYIEDLTKGEVILHDGAVYPALVALEEEGIVTLVWEEPKTYKLTAAGRRRAKLERKQASQIFRLRAR